MFPRLPDIPAPRRVPHRRSWTSNRNWLLISRQRRGLDRAMWERDRYRHRGGRATAGRMSQTHARSAGKNTCREVKVRHRVYSYVRYSKVLDSDVHVEARRCLQDEKLTKYLLTESLAHPGRKCLCRPAGLPAIGLIWGTLVVFVGRKNLARYTTHQLNTHTHVIGFFRA